MVSDSATNRYEIWKLSRKPSASIWVIPTTPATPWPHQDRQLEDLKIRCDHLTKRNTALEAEVDTIK